MHEFLAEDRFVLGDITDWIGARLSDRAADVTPVASVSVPSVQAEGVGTAVAWASLRDVILPTAFPTDHPRYLAFVGGAPTPAAVLAEAAMSAAAVYGGSQLEAGAVVAAERAAIRWLCDVLGYPADAHGTFVSGGSTANLSALVAARHGRQAPGGRPPGLVVAGASAHSSVRSAAAIMGCDVVVAGSPDAPLSSADLEEVLATLDPADVVAIVASAGATNTGAVDALDEIALTCGRLGIWLHVDAAYGGAAMLAPASRSLFRGIERADSVTVDPHKWLFTPFDCAAVVYRDPTVARAAHRQSAHYLDATLSEDADNPGRLRRPPDPSGPRDPVVGLAGRPRHRRLRRCGRAVPGDGGPRRQVHRGERRAGGRHRAAAVRRALPLPRLASRRLRPVVAAGLAQRADAGHADDLRRGDRAASVLREPDHLRR